MMKKQGKKRERKNGNITGKKQKGCLDHCVEAAFLFLEVPVVKNPAYGIL